MKRQFKTLAITALLVAFASCKSSQPKAEPEAVPAKREQSQAQGEKKRPSPEMMLQQMDTNKDGKISKLEAKGKLSENFQRKDTNNDGFITKAELTQKHR